MVCIYTNINNKKNNQQLRRSTPTGTPNQGAASEPPPADPHHQFRFMQRATFSAIIIT